MFDRRDTKAVKGVAICLMLYHHLFAFSDRSLDYVPLVSIGGFDSASMIGAFGRICVATFFFLGGYGTYLATRTGVFDKIGALYKSFWKIFLLVVPVGVMFGDLWIDLSAIPLLTNVTAVDTSYNDEWWFLRAYVAIVLVFPLIRRFIDRGSGVFAIDAAWVAVIAVISDTIPIMYAGTFGYDSAVTVKIHKFLYDMSEGLPCVVLGASCARHGVLDKAKDRLPNARRGYLTSASIVVAVFIARQLFRQSAVLDPVLVVPFVAAATALVGNGLPRRVFERLGGESTGIWLTHSFWCYHWAPALVYSPRASICIFLLLLALSYATERIALLPWDAISRRLSPQTCSR